MLTLAQKKDWIDALRSGKYEQTTQVLLSTNGCYCALGVLCEINKALAHDPEGMIYQVAATNWIWEHLGIDGYDKIVDLNDGVRWDFNAIADYIEKHFPVA